MLKKLLTLMTQELPTDLECMKKAFKVLDSPLVEKTAHKIKGGAVYVETICMKYACPSDPLSFFNRSCFLK